MDKGRYPRKENKNLRKGIKMIDQVKTIERVKNRLQEQLKKYNDARNSFTEAMRSLEGRISDFKSKADLRKTDLNERIRALENQLAEKIGKALEDNPGAESEMKSLSVDIELARMQLSALSEAQHKTIISNFQKDLEKVRRLHREVALQHQVLYLLYGKLFEAINQLKTELSRLTEGLEPGYSNIYGDILGVTLPDNDRLKTVAEFLFDTNIREPGPALGNTNPTAYDIVYKYYLNEVKPDIDPEAKRIIERM